MSGRTALLRCSAFALANLCGVAVAAAPGPDDICHEGVVVRERLVMFALTKAGVSRYPERWAAANPDPNYPSPSIRVLADGAFCNEAAAPASADGSPKCTAEDKAAIEKARTFVEDVLQGGVYANPLGLTSAKYLIGPDAGLACPSAEEFARARKEPLTPPDLAKLPLRVRGSTDGLQFRRGNSQFAALERATLTFKDDDEAGKDTFKVTAVVGVAVPVTRRVELVPYVGFGIDKSTKNGEKADVTAETLRAGALLNYRLETSGGVHYFLMRPEFSANRKERSEVLTNTFGYVPITTWLNDYVFRLPSDGRSVFSIMPRGDLRMAYGHFIKQGSRPDGSSTDFYRVGAQVGFTVTSDVEWLPFDFTATETYLHGLAGDPDHLSQLRLLLTANLDKQKVFGIDLGYVRGRLEDLRPREENWTIGFGAKF